MIAISPPTDVPEQNTLVSSSTQSITRQAQQRHPRVTSKITDLVTFKVGAAPAYRERGVPTDSKKKGLSYLHSSGTLAASLHLAVSGLRFRIVSMRPERPEHGGSLPLVALPGAGEQKGVCRCKLGMNSHLEPDHDLYRSSKTV